MTEDEIRLLQERLQALRRRQRRERIPVGDLSQSAVRVLSAAARAGGAAQPAQLADETRMTSSNVAAALRELEAAGMVGRSRDDADARKVNVRLTDAGATVIAESRGVREAWLAHAIDALLDEREQRVLAEASELIGRLAGYDPGRRLAEGRP
jgi:DNA-binding MarR family transcriptional regulator